MSTFEFVKAHRAEHAVAKMCRLLEVSESGCYAWLDWAPSARSVADQALQAKIETIHQGSRGTYGVPRVHVELLDDGVRVGLKRVAHLVPRSGLQGASRPKTLFTTKRVHDARPAPDLVERSFTALQRDTLWVADITYIQTWTGFLHLAVVMAP